MFLNFCSSDNSWNQQSIFTRAGVCSFSTASATFNTSRLKLVQKVYFPSKGRHTHKNKCFLLVGPLRGKPQEPLGTQHTFFHQMNKKNINLSSLRDLVAQSLNKNKKFCVSSFSSASHYQKMLYLPMRRPDTSSLRQLILGRASITNSAY